MGLQLPAWPWEECHPRVGKRQLPLPSETASKSLKELIAYGERSRYVTSIRVPVAERMSPDMFGLTFHVSTPL